MGKIFRCAVFALFCIALALGVCACAASADDIELVETDERQTQKPAAPQSNTDNSSSADDTDNSGDKDCDDDSDDDYVEDNGEYDDDEDDGKTDDGSSDSTEDNHDTGNTPAKPVTPPSGDSGNTDDVDNTPSTPSSGDSGNTEDSGNTDGSSSTGGDAPATPPSTPVNPPAPSVGDNNDDSVWATILPNGSTPYYETVSDTVRIKNFPPSSDGIIHIPSKINGKDVSAINCLANNSASAFVVDASNKYFASDDYGVLFNKDKTQLQRCPTSLSGQYVVPATVKDIRPNAFEHCNRLTEVVLQPNSALITIDQSAFAECTSLVTVDLRYATKFHRIKKYAFQNDVNLSDVFVSVPLYKILWNDERGEDQPFSSGCGYTFIGCPLIAAKPYGKALTEVSLP